jgi:GNAT superfamily N-acetyltransferase
MSIRRATDHDAPAAIAIVRDSITQLCAADHRNDAATLERWLANKNPQTFVAWIANPDNFCVVAASGSQLHGVGLLQRRGEVLLFYLAPGQQRRGIGARIHAALEEQARAWRLSRMYLQSTRLACAFYEAMGYREAGPALRLFGVMDAYPYEKVLAAT